MLLLLLLLLWGFHPSSIPLRYSSSEVGLRLLIGALEEPMLKEIGFLQDATFDVPVRYSMQHSMCLFQYSMQHSMC